MKPEGAPEKTGEGEPELAGKGERGRTSTRSGPFRGIMASDCLTLARGLISLTLFAFIPLGIKSVGLGTILYIVGWTTDILDGRIARAFAKEGRLARWDFPLDMILTGAGAAYCAYMGIIPWLFFWIWGVLWLLLSVITRNQAVIMLIAFVCHVVSGIGLARAEPLWFWVLVAWIALVLALDFRRFGQVVLNFIRSAGEWIGR